jgi:hypothetical protein
MKPIATPSATLDVAAPPAESRCQHVKFQVRVRAP